MVRWIIMEREDGRRSPHDMVTRDGGLGLVKREP